MVKTLPSNASSIPGQGIKISSGAGCSQKPKKKLSPNVVGSPTYNIDGFNRCFLSFTLF